MLHQLTKQTAAKPTSDAGVERGSLGTPARDDGPEAR